MLTGDFPVGRGVTLPLEQVFLADIAVDPCDAMPRLVYADWLEEQGRADHAAFIRPEYPPPLLGRGRETCRWFRYAGRLMSGVVRKSWQVWPINHPHPEHPGESFAALNGPCGFSSAKPPFVVALRHGFAEAAAVGPKRFRMVAPALFAAQPVRAVVLIGKFPEQEEGGRFWGRSWGDEQSFWRVPHEAFNRLSGEIRPGPPGYGPGPAHFYPSSRLAYEDLSRACVRWGREWAGLPPWDGPQL